MPQTSCCATNRLHGRTTGSSFRTPPRPGYACAAVPSGATIRGQLPRKDVTVSDQVHPRLPRWRQRKRAMVQESREHLGHIADLARQRPRARGGRRPTVHLARRRAPVPRDGAPFAQQLHRAGWEGLPRAADAVAADCRVAQRHCTCTRHLPKARAVAWQSINTYANALRPPASTHGADSTCTGDRFREDSGETNCDPRHSQPPSGVVIVAVQMAARICRFWRRREGVACT